MSEITAQVSPILTIALPVRDDAKALVESIRAILPQLEELTPVVEIIVSDNCSSDDSFQCALEALDGRTYSKAIRPDSNLGFAGNLKFLTSEARGKYIWFVGAGDIPAKQSVQEVLAVLYRDSPDWLVMECRFKWTRTQETDAKLESTSRVSEAENLAPMFNFALSGNVFRTELVRGYSPLPPLNSLLEHNLQSVGKQVDIWRQEQSYWPHIECIKQFLELNPDKNDNWVYLPSTIVYLDQNKNGSWNERSSVLKIYGQWISLTKSLEVLSPDNVWLKGESKRLSTSHLWAYVFRVKKEGILSNHELRQELRSIDVHLLSRLVCTSLTFVPKQILKYVAVTRGAISRLRFKRGTDDHRGFGRVLT